jgi:transporter family-2 protein
MIMGGLMAVIVVGGNAVIAPLTGTGIVTVMNLVGMMGSALVIDAIGFLGIEVKPVTVSKITGMLLMIAGTAIISL